MPSVYWSVLVSVVGTLITDNLTDNFGVSLVTTTVVFSAVLVLVFAVWYASEQTLSIHTIFTLGREAFYWLTVLFTFALGGTATGDLIAERLNVGYWKSAILFGGLIAVVYVAHRFFRVGAILAFWIAYILTRPLGASTGDEPSQAHADGGLGLNDRNERRLSTHDPRRRRLPHYHRQGPHRGPGHGLTSPTILMALNAPGAKRC